MNKSQMDSIRMSVESVFATFSVDDIRSLVKSSYAELREEHPVLVAA